MRKVMLMAGVAALAASVPAFAQGNGKGNGGGNDGGNHGGGGPEKAQKADHGPQKAKGPDKRAEMRPEKPRRNDARPEQAMRGNPGQGPERNDAPRNYEKAERQVDRDYARRADRGDERTVVRVTSRQWQDGRYRYDDRRFLIPVTSDCPPGLAKKNNGCLPPGQARQIQAPRSWGDWYPVRYLGNDYDWRYGNGSMYRIGSGGLVSAIVPLLGGALFGGQVWPTQYTDYAVPSYYDRYYGFDDGYDYRYAQNAIFEVDPQSNMIEGIAALLTGDPWAVGQPMPAGYDLYNVPPDWRGRYADTPDSWYRYSDGYVYEVDPTTQLVRAVIELIA
ncbi:hypothetical protein [Novosphingobium jiangmenense]|uniref:RcnB family protein n=1 Tax=Novosphingobium jiangmenense TaxID=2791981 RepID=A0ABS0HKP7_9SPHN|nr:hypothetical protein [Novosphingobium jiangmenense]MBF9152821.1 hypothetical protein [Novosphingobium jiangmenense]